jgi:hypothetical protein
VNTGGHSCNSHFVPALFPPQTVTVNSRLAAMSV